MFLMHVCWYIIICSTKNGKRMFRSRIIDINGWQHSFHLTLILQGWQKQGMNGTKCEPRCYEIIFFVILTFVAYVLKNLQHFHYQCLQQYKNNAKANFIIHNCLFDVQLSSSTIYYAKDMIITEYRLTTIINLNQSLG